MRLYMGFLRETLFFVENSVDFLCMFAFQVFHRRWIMQSEGEKWYNQEISKQAPVVFGPGCSRYSPGERQKVIHRQGEHERNSSTLSTSYPQFSHVLCTVAVEKQQEKTPFRFWERNGAERGREITEYIRRASRAAAPFPPPSPDTWGRCCPAPRRKRSWIPPRRAG